jgi:hypothetical protein
MMVRGTLVLGAACTVLALASCTSTAPRLPVPEGLTGGQLVVSPRSPDLPNHEFVIDDARTVERFLSFLRAHNNGWRTPWDTFPIPQYTVSLKRNKELVLVIWVGTNWLGGREGSGGDNRLRSLSDQERTEVLQILGVPKE